MSSPALHLSLLVRAEADGRFYGLVPEVPGVMAYGVTHAEAIGNTTRLLFDVLADRVEHGETDSLAAVQVTLHLAA